jgi:hypothetical protein
MGVEVASQAELVGPERAALADDAPGLLLDSFEITAGHLAGDRSGQLIHQHHLRAQSPHHPRPLDGVPFRQHGDKRIALDGTDSGQAGAGVAAGQFDHGLTGLQGAGGLGLLDHLACNAVFLRKPRIEEFQFCHDAPGQTAREPSQFHQRGLADSFNGRGQQGVRT